MTICIVANIYSLIVKKRAFEMPINPSELNFENAIEYHHGQFPPSNLDYERLIKPLSGAVDAIARFDQMLTTLKNSDVLLAPLRNQEAVISSRMEGTISTMDEILRYEADYEEGKLSNGAVRSEVIETILYQRALRSAERAMSEGASLTQHMIRSLHQVLLSWGRGARKSPGMYKDEQNYIVGKKREVLFIPINPQNLTLGMDRLLDYINNDNSQILIKTANAHLEFEALHPFKDGNGRVGRMLITLMLWNSKVISAPHFYISGYLEEQKSEYTSLMREVSETGNWTDWCEFFLNAIEVQANKNLNIANSISELYEEMKAVFSELLASKYSINALDFIFANPVFRNGKFSSQSGIPNATARRFTPILANAGLLDTIDYASGSRSAMYRFEPMMDLVRV